MTINGFKGKYAFLSNMYPCLIRYDGYLFPAAEEAFQSAKSTDPEIRILFTATQDSKEAKRFGKHIPLREDWEAVKDQVMEDVVRIKFTTNNELKEKLLATEDAELIENNTWGDTYWGVCKGQGQNKLGKIIMKVRTELQS